MGGPAGGLTGVRVLFDAFWWTSGPVSNRQVLREVVRHWVRLHPEDEVHLALRHRDREAALADLADLPVASTVTTRLWPHGVAAIADYPRLARKVGADVTLTHNFTPVVGRSAVFVHDVMFQTDPGWFTRPERLYYSLIPLLLPRADVVMTSSRNEARRIAARNPRVADVEPVGLAVGTELAGARPQRPEGVDEGQPYVLSVGRLNVRKNLGLTFAAALRSGAVGPDLPLLVVGEKEGVAVQVSPEVRRAVEDGSIRFLGRLSDAELVWLYGHARLFVYLSLDEGFGLPPLEALTFGAPLLVSDIAVFRETVGGQATFTDPHDVDAAAAAIARLVREGTPVTSPRLPTWDECVERMRSAVVHSLTTAPQRT